MGRVFIDHLGGVRVIYCTHCSTPLTSKENMESASYQGSTGKAYLFTAAINIYYSRVVERSMMTGRHFVRDVYCKGCSTKIGWMYEFACPVIQRHKEGKIILEKAFIKEHK